MGPLIVSSGFSLWWTQSKLEYINFLGPSEAVCQFPCLALSLLSICQHVKLVTVGKI